MVRIQLETGYLDVTDNTDFPLNFGVADVRDLSKRSGAFSKSIKLPATDNNNQLLNHYYDVNIEAGTFDVDALTKCAVIQNDIPILEDAYIQLVSIDKEQHSDGHDERVVYNVLIKDAQADFFTKIDNSELTDLDFSDLNHTYSSANVVSAFSNTVTDGYTYSLCISGDNNYALTEFKPAIYAKLYWDRIHSNAGFSYTWSKISTDKFDTAVVPYNGEDVQIDHDSYIVDFTKSSFIPTLGSAITSFTEVTDAENIFNPTTGVYDVPFYVSGSQSIDFEFTFDLDVELVNATGANAYLVDMTASATDHFAQYQPRIYVYKNGVLVGSAFAVIGNEYWYESDNPLASGTTSIGTLTSTVNVSLSNLLPSDDLTFVLDITESFSLLPTQLRWKDGANPTDTDVTITSQLNVTSMRGYGIVSANTLSFGQTLDMNTFIPKKIKQKDFIKSMCLRWNLYVEQDPDNPNKLIYKSRDDYYDGGTEKDWTYKLSKERTQQLMFLPDLTAKKLILSDKQDDDPYNDIYLEATNEVYGQVEFTYDNAYVKGIDRKETIFSPTPITETIFNAVVPAYVGSTPENNIRLLLHNGTDTCDAYNIYDYGTTGQTGLTSYPVVSHFDDNRNPTFDLNFGVCDYYFYENIVKTNNNMYNLFWRRTINQINTGKMLVGYFDLDEADIQTLALSDKIRIDNSWWHINRVIDYNPNKPQLTKVELMSVDTEIDLAPFKTKKPIKPALPNNPLTDLVDLFYENNNVNRSKGSTIIKGVNNVVPEGIRAVVIGDNGDITSDGYWLNGERIGNIEGYGRTYNTIIVSGDYISDPNYDELIVSDTAGVTITIPTPRDYEGKKIYVKNKSTGNITLTTVTGKLIDKKESHKLSSYEALTVMSDGVIWLIL